VEITIDHTPELLSPPRPNLYPSGQSAPLLEATCVDDEVYDAVPVSDDHGWSRRTQKYMMLGLVSIGFLATAAITGVAVVLTGSQNEGTELSVAAVPQINETIPNNTTRPENGTTSVMVVFPNSTTRPESGINTSMPSPSRSPTLFITENNVSEKLTAC